MHYIPLSVLDMLDIFNFSPTFEVFFPPPHPPFSSHYIVPNVTSPIHCPKCNLAMSSPISLVPCMLFCLFTAE